MSITTACTRCFRANTVFLLAALDRYRSTVTSEFGTALKEAEPTAAGLLGAFDRLFDLMTTEDGQVGCLMCNSASELASHDEVVAAKVRAHLDHLADLFEEWLDRIDRADAELELRSAAELLATSVYSLALLLRTGYVRAHVRKQVENDGRSHLVKFFEEFHIDRYEMTNIQKEKS